MFDESKCIVCGDCLVRCKYVDYTQEEAVEQIAALLEGEPADILSRCVDCVACNEYCPEGANPFDLICQLQEKTGALPVPEAYSSAMDQIPNAVPSEVIEGDRDKPVLSLCIEENNIPKGTLDSEMFEGLTVVKGGEFFDYLGYIHIGKERPIRQNASKFVDRLASLGAEEIIFVHPDCYAMLTYKAREYGIDVPFRPVHVVQYMLEYLKKHQTSITKLGIRVAYQRPCSSRYNPEIEVILDELFELIGTERVARKYDRQEALCCGSGFRLIFPDKAAEVRDMNLDDARDHGAQVVVSTCPACLRSFRKGCQERGIVPIFITELCQMALGEKPLPL